MVLKLFLKFTREYWKKTTLQPCLEHSSGKLSPWNLAVCHFKLLTPEAFGMCLLDMPGSASSSLHSTEIPQGGRGGIWGLRLQPPWKSSPEGPRAAGPVPGCRCSRGDKAPAGTAIPGNLKPSISHPTAGSAVPWARTHFTEPPQQSRGCASLPCTRLGNTRLSPNATERAG